MGLSTIAFYSEPTHHLSNALIGAGAGLVVGLGVAAYLLSNASQDDEINPDDLLPPENKPDGPGKTPGKTPGAPGGGSGGGSGKQGPGAQGTTPLRPRSQLAQLLTSVPATLAMRDTSDWTVALRVLELRF